jgi:hypothetical protein
LGILQYFAADGADVDTTVAKFTCEVDDGSPEAGYVGTAFVWLTMPGGNNNPLTERMRLTAAGVLDISGGGIKFPSSQSASSDVNTLDDYEEGTWTPTFVAATAGSPSSSGNGTYTKIGNLVTATFYLSVSSLGGASGNVNVGGLPFAGGDYVAAGSVSTASSLALSAAGMSLTLQMNGGSIVTVQVWDGTIGITPIQASEWSDGGTIGGAITYMV